MTHLSFFYFMYEVIGFALLSAIDVPRICFPTTRYRIRWF